MQNRYDSISCITHAGWHKVNDLYQIDRTSIRPEAQSQHLLIYTLAGKGFLEADGTPYTLTPGTLAVIPGYLPHRYRCVTDETWEFQWFHYSGLYPSACTHDIESGGILVFSLIKGENQDVQYHISRFMNNHSMGIERMLTEAEVIDGLLRLALRKSLTLNNDKTEKKLSDEIICYIEMSDNLSLEQLVERYHYSKKHIIRIFKSHTGMTPYNYWIISRLKKSCVLLEENNLSINEIAKVCGYKITSHYSSQFKSYFGITPTDYRMKYTSSISQQR